MNTPVFGSASVAPAYEDICIDPIFDMTFEAQEAIGRYEEVHGAALHFDPFAFFDEEEEEET